MGVNTNESLITIRITIQTSSQFHNLTLEMLKFLISLKPSSPFLIFSSVFLCLMYGLFVTNITFERPLTTKRN